MGRTADTSLTFPSEQQNQLKQHTNASKGVIPQRDTPCRTATHTRPASIDSLRATVLIHSQDATPQSGPGILRYLSCLDKVQSLLCCTWCKIYTWCVTDMGNMRNPCQDSWPHAYLARYLSNQFNAPGSMLLTTQPSGRGEWTSMKARSSDPVIL